MLYQGFYNLEKPGKLPETLEFVMNLENTWKNTKITWKNYYPMEKAHFYQNRTKQGWESPRISAVRGFRGFWPQNDLLILFQKCIFDLDFDSKQPGIFLKNLKITWKTPGKWSSFFCRNPENIFKLIFLCKIE